MQVLYMTTYWLRFWSQLKSDDQDKGKIAEVSLGGSHADL
jgi:hypothetical protein